METGLEYFGAVLKINTSKNLVKLRNPSISVAVS